MKKRILAAMLTLSMVVSMTACGNSDAGGSKDSAKNNGNGDEPYTVTMVLNGSTQPDEERIEQKINEILEPELNANLDFVVLPWASASQQLQLMLSGDEKIDFLFDSFFIRLCASIQNHGNCIWFIPITVIFS